MIETPIRVGIVGGSLAGLNAALWLREAGCEVSVYEQSNMPRIGVGDGIVLNPATTRWFTEHGGELPAALSVKTESVRYLDFRGDVIAELAQEFHIASYQTLYHALLEAFGEQRYRLGRTVIKSAQSTSQVVAYFSDESNANLDLLVCADGLRSHYRQNQVALMPELAPRYVGYGAWHGVVRPADVPTELFNRLFNAITYHVMPRGHMVVYPVPSNGADELPHLNWHWYRNATEGTELDQLMTDRDGTRHTDLLPAGALRDEQVLALWHEAGDHLPARLAALIGATTQPFIRAIHECEAMRIAHNRVCAIGDAGFVLRPHTAAATAKGAEDGYQLACALREHDFDVRAALKTWEARQLALGQRAFEQARDVGDQLQFESSWNIGAPLPYGLRVPGDSASA